MICNSRKGEVMISIGSAFKKFALASLVAPFALSSLAAAAPVNSDSRLTLEVEPMAVSRPAPRRDDGLANTIATVPAPRTVSAGQARSVAAMSYDERTDEFKPVRLRGDFAIRSEPASGSARVGAVRDSLADSDIIIIGQKSVDAGNGKQDTWIQVLFHDEPAWIHSAAFIDQKLIRTAQKLAPAHPAIHPTAPVSHPLARVVPTSRPAAPMLPVEVAPVVSAPAVAPPTVPEAPTVIAQDPPPRPPADIPAPVAPSEGHRDRPGYVRHRADSGPSCISTAHDMHLSERFHKALRGINPFTRWSGPMGAYLDVSPTGHATLYHPLKGMIPTSISICLDESNTVYATVNGAVVYFEGPDLSTAQITDPGSGSSYTFTRTAN
jgi:hypothetical protein